VVSSTPRPHFIPGRDPVPIVQEAGWAPAPVCTGGKSRPHRDSIPERPARSSVAIPTELPGARIYIYMHTHTHTYIHTYTHTYTHTHTHTHIHTHIHTYIKYIHMWLYIKIIMMQNIMRKSSLETNVSKCDRTDLCIF